MKRVAHREDGTLPIELADDVLEGKMTSEWMGQVSWVGVDGFHVPYGRL